MQNDFFAIMLQKLFLTYFIDSQLVKSFLRLFYKEQLMICDRQKSVKNILAKACYLFFNVSITSVKMGKPAMAGLSADFPELRVGECIQSR